MATTGAGSQPDADSARLELTVRGLLLGGLITLAFTAANVYLGLKVGLTFASSIPAAVISMAVLRPFRNSTIYENNIVQTVASAAGTLSSIIFVLPGLVMIGWWTGFPFWQSFGICVVGGVLGVMYTIPLRRALVTNSDLPYPEGVAAAEVLKVGSGSRGNAHDDADAAANSRAGLLAVVWGSIASAVFYLFTQTGIAAQEAAAYFRVGNAAIGHGRRTVARAGRSRTPRGPLGGYRDARRPGHRMGHCDAGAHVAAPRRRRPSRLRTSPSTCGATRCVSSAPARSASPSIWTLGKFGRPRVERPASRRSRRRARMSSGDAAALPRTRARHPHRARRGDQRRVLLPLAVLLATFLTGGLLAGMIVPLVIAAIAYIVVVGFLVAAVCGYMAGLIGSSNSPVSGLAILTVLGASLLLLALAGGLGGAAKETLVAYALFITAVVLCVATIANDNLQDLKTGQLVDSTPWRQQVALIVGVVFGALVIPPVLDLLHYGYGFPGEPHPIAPHGAQPLAAPQATLISALAKGVIEGSLHWDLLGIGVLVGIGIIAIDERCARPAACACRRLPSASASICRRRPRWRSSSARSPGTSTTAGRKSSVTARWRRSSACSSRRV